MAASESGLWADQKRDYESLPNLRSLLRCQLQRDEDEPFVFACYVTKLVTMNAWR